MCPYLTAFFFGVVQRILESNKSGNAKAVTIEMLRKNVFESL